MKREQLEDLFLNGLDQSLPTAERQKITDAMGQDEDLAKDLSGYLIMREEMRRKTPATFGPYFSARVVTAIKNMRVEIDQQIMFFFRRYQLAALGVLVALLTLNVVFADQINIPSLLGITEESAPVQEDELMSFDFYDNFNE